MSGFLLSLSLCLDLGIVNVAIMKTGVERGMFPALMIGLGSGLGDLVYASLSLVGISFLLGVPIVRWVLWMGGTIVLLYMTVTMIRHSLSPRRIDSPRVGGTRRRESLTNDFVSGIGLALSSPSAILWFATVGGSVIASTRMASQFSLLFFFGGFFVASNLWSVTLAYLCHQGGRMMGPELMRWFSLVSAGVFLFFAVKVFLNGYTTLL
ncbi:MAG: LysE family transporter [Ignavibacteriae bacterium]|nr:LysE family transporter [Ignavibacteriota bacterium]